MPPENSTPASTQAEAASSIHAISNGGGVTNGPILLKYDVSKGDVNKVTLTSHLTLSSHLNWKLSDVTNVSEPTRESVNGAAPSPFPWTVSILILHAFLSGGNFNTNKPAAAAAAVVGLHASVWKATSCILRVVWRDDVVSRLESAAGAWVELVAQITNSSGKPTPSVAELNNTGVNSEEHAMGGDVHHANGEKMGNSTTAARTAVLAPSSSSQQQQQQQQHEEKEVAAASVMSSINIAPTTATTANGVRPPAAAAITTSTVGGGGGGGASKRKSKHPQSTAEVLTVAPTAHTEAGVDVNRRSVRARPPPGYHKMLDEAVFAFSPNKAQKVGGGRLMRGRRGEFTSTEEEDDDDDGEEGDEDDEEEEEDGERGMDVDREENDEEESEYEDVDDDDMDEGEEGGGGGRVRRPSANRTNKTGRKQQQQQQPSRRGSRPSPPPSAPSSFAQRQQRHQHNQQGVPPPLYGSSTINNINNNNHISPTNAALHEDLLRKAQTLLQERDKIDSVKSFLLEIALRLRQIAELPGMPGKILVRGAYPVKDELARLINALAGAQQKLQQPIHQPMAQQPQSFAGKPSTGAAAAQAPPQAPPAYPRPPMYMNNNLNFNGNGGARPGAPGMGRPPLPPHLVAAYQQQQQQQQRQRMMMMSGRGGSTFGGMTGGVARTSPSSSTAMPSGAASAASPALLSNPGPLNNAGASMQANAVAAPPPPPPPTTTTRPLPPQFAALVSALGGKYNDTVSVLLKSIANAASAAQQVIYVDGLARQLVNVIRASQTGDVKLPVPPQFCGADGELDAGKVAAALKNLLGNFHPQQQQEQHNMPVVAAVAGGGTALAPLQQEPGAPPLSAPLLAAPLQGTSTAGAAVDGVQHTSTAPPAVPEAVPSAESASLQMIHNVLCQLTDLNDPLAAQSTLMQLMQKIQSGEIALPAESEGTQKLMGQIMQVQAALNVAMQASGAQHSTAPPPPAPLVAPGAAAPERATTTTTTAAGEDVPTAPPPAPLPAAAAAPAAAGAPETTTATTTTTTATAGVEAVPTAPPPSSSLSEQADDDGSGDPRPGGFNDGISNVATTINPQTDALLLPQETLDEEEDV